MRANITHCLTISLLCFSFSLANAQDRATKNISAVYAQGKVNGSEYVNEYFGIILSSVGGTFTQGGFVSASGTRTRLIDVQNNAGSWQDKFSIAVLADSLSANPLIRAPEQYVRAVRHQFQKQGMITVTTESTTQISGLSFVHAILKVNETAGTHYQGIYTTFLKGYILSLDVSAATPEKVDQLVTKAVRFKTHDEQ